MTGQHHSAEECNGGEKKNNKVENNSDEIDSKHCDALGFPECCLDEDDDAASDETEPNENVPAKSRAGEEAVSSEAPVKKRRMAMMNSRKLVFRVVTKMMSGTFDKNLIEKTEHECQSESFGSQQH